MTLPATWFAAAIISTTMSVAIAGCGDNEDSGPSGGGTGASAGIGGAGGTAGTAGGGASAGIGGAGGAGTGGTAGSAGGGASAGMGGAGTGGTAGSAGGGGVPIGGECGNTEECTDGAICSGGPWGPNGLFTLACRRQVPTCHDSPCGQGEGCYDVFDNEISHFCGPQSAAGAECSPGVDNCQEGYFCGWLNGICEEKLQPDAECLSWDDHPCVDGYACPWDFCEPEKGLHDPCISTTECEVGLRCDKDLGTCELLSSPGGPCQAIEESCILGACYGYTTDCEVGLECVSTSSQGCFTSSDCDSGFYCCTDQNNVGACTDSPPFDCEHPIGECAVY